MRHLITPWSIGWHTDVVFSGEKKIACHGFSIIGWAKQLSMINALSSDWNFLFTSVTHSSNKILSIQLFLCDRYLQESFLMFLKHLGFFALPIKNVGSLLPTALAAAKPVILILLCLPPEHFSVSTNRICLVNNDKTTWIRRRCKYSQDRN